MAELTLKERLRKAAMTVDQPGRRSTMVSALAGPLGPGRETHRITV